MFGRGLLATLVVVVVGSSAHAQSASPAPRGFVDVGIALANDDAANRTRFPDDGSNRVWLVTAGGWLTPRVGLGGEYVDLGRVTGGTSGVSFRIADEQDERALLGMVHVRAVARSRVALVVLGGAGVLFQDRTTTFSSLYPPPSERVTSVRRQSPALVLGADVPITLTPHLAAVGFGRVYILARGELETLDVVYHSSARVALGGRVRVEW